MKFSVIDTKIKLERLILHLESIPGAGNPDAQSLIDQFISDQDMYALDTALMFKSPDFAEYLVRLFRLSVNSKLERKVKDALVAMGNVVVNDMLIMLDGDHGPRASMVLAEIGGDTAFRALTGRVKMSPDYIAAAIRVSVKNADDAAVDFLVKFIEENKPLGFRESLLKREENQNRVIRTNLASKALRDITGQNFQKAEEWVEWRKKNPIYSNQRGMMDNK